MKTSWSNDYLKRKYGTANVFLSAKRREYEQKYNVPFCVWSSHEQTHVRPWVKLNRKQAGIEQDYMILNGYHSEHEAAMLDEICSYTNEWGVSIVRLHELTGFSLIDIIRTVRFMIHNQGYLSVTNRLGKCEGVKYPFNDF